MDCSTETELIMSGDQVSQWQVINLFTVYTSAQTAEIVPQHGNSAPPSKAASKVQYLPPTSVADPGGLDRARASPPFLQAKIHENTNSVVASCACAGDLVHPYTSYVQAL